jgi:porin
MSKLSTCATALIHFSIAAVGPTLFAGAASAQGFGSPDAVENQIKNDRDQIDALFEPAIFDQWYALKDDLAKETGFSFGIDYSSVGFVAMDSPGADGAASGMVRLFGSWDLIGRGTLDTGALVFKGEHRHSYTDVPVSGYGFDVGYVGPLNAPFNDQGLRLSNLYWRQRLGDGRATVTAGFLDVTDYVDAFALGSPWLHFSNLAFSTGSGAIGLPNEAALGIAGGVYLTDHIYTIAGFADANADPTDPFDGFDSFFDENDYFTSLEVGWTSSRERLIFDNVHATLWRTDGSDEFGVDDGWGIAGSATWYVNDRWLPFLRGGFANDGGALLAASVSAGLGWQPMPGPGRDVLGLGLNWGRPNSDSFGPGLDDQWTGEIFYRINLGKHVAVTPDVQVLINPALNPDKDVIGIFGLRARLAL